MAREIDAASGCEVHATKYAGVFLSYLVRKTSAYFCAPSPSVSRERGAAPAGPAYARGRMRIATWNVNSLKARLPRVEEWLAYAQPDVLCMQETKLADGAFPSLAFAALGYEAAHCGQGQWNGVAILSRVGLDDVVAGFSDEAEDETTEARLLWATCGGVRVGSVYVPNGRMVGSEFYEAKLAWLERLRQHLVDRVRPRRAAGGLRRLQRRARRPRRLGPDQAPRRHPREPAGAGGGGRPGRVGPGRRLPPALPGGAAVLVVGLPGRRLPPGPGPAHRPHPGHPGAGRPADWALIDRFARKGKLPSDHAPLLADFD